MKSPSELEQGSEEWHDFRLKGIGSSDAPVIMGVSPWKTPFGLWEEKLGLREDLPKSLFILDKGHKLEVKARAQYELKMNCEAKPICLVNPHYEWMRASLDGWVEKHQRCVEIKFQGKDAHEGAREGLISEKYKYQMIHQMMVAGSRECDFVSINDEEETVIYRFHYNVKMAADLLEAEKKFWALVQKEFPPELIEGDFKKPRKKGLTALKRKLVKEHNQYIKAKMKFNQTRMEFFQMLPDEERMMVDGLRIFNYKREDGPFIEWGEE